MFGNKFSKTVQIILNAKFGNLILQNSIILFGKLPVRGQGLLVDPISFTFLRSSSAAVIALLLPLFFAISSTASTNCVISVSDGFSFSIITPFRYMSYTMYDYILPEHHFHNRENTLNKKPSLQVCPRHYILHTHFFMCFINHRRPAQLLPTRACT